MTRNEIIEKIADYFGIEYDEIDKTENGDYDINNDSNFQTKCILSGGKYVNLADIVKLIEEDFNY